LSQEEEEISRLRDMLAERDGTIHQLERKLRDKEDELKEQLASMHKLQESHAHLEVDVKALERQKSLLEIQVARLEGRLERGQAEKH